MGSMAMEIGNILVGQVSKPYPFDGAVGVSTASDLAWERPEGGADRYDVYFGTVADPPFVLSQTRIVYDPGRLQPDTAYYWRVDAILGERTSAGKVYRFTTGSAPAQPARPGENGTVLLQDDFGAPGGSWQPVTLKGAAGGSFRIAGRKLNLRADGADTIYGVYNTTPVSGHFYAEVSYDTDDFAGLALLRQKDGQPDTGNYVMMSLSREDGVVHVTANDMQNGAPDVLGTKQGIPAEQYRVRLDGTQYSVPFVGTAKRFQLMHEALWGSFRYLFKVQAEMKGQLASGWMETRGSPDWSDDPANEPYYVALLVKAGVQPGAEASFTGFRIVQKPTEDRDDTNTGFAVTRGEYNWSGYFDDAVVVTFGSEFPYAADDRKFVFWGCSNDTPHWHINNQSIYYNEFLETWEDLATYPNLLCFEPMSDRMRRFTNVEVIEDNAVRKVVQWAYTIVDPDYRYPGDPVGEQQAEAVETYTIYRDGTIMRKQRYTPKLDNGIVQQGNEVQETIVVAGSKTWYPDLITHPSMAVYNLQGDVREFYPNSGVGDIDAWDQFIMSMNLYDGVAPFVAYSTASDTRDVFPYPVKLGVHTKYNISEERIGASHWPVQKAPYEIYMWSMAHLTSEASQWSFFSAGNWAGSTGWEQWDLPFQTTYDLDERGRKYREWVSLVGMADVGDLETPKDLVRSWLHPGAVTVDSPGCAFMGNDRHSKSLVFRNDGPNGIFKFTLAPSAITMRPTVEVQGWGAGTELTVSIDGAAQAPGTDYVACMQGASLLVWFSRSFSSETKFEISAVSRREAAHGKD